MAGLNTFGAPGFIADHRCAARFDHTAHAGGNRSQNVATAAKGKSSAGGGNKSLIAGFSGIVSAACAVKRVGGVVTVRPEISANSKRAGDDAGESVGGESANDDLNVA